jgi:hypothetical protein
VNHDDMTYPLSKQAIEVIFAALDAQLAGLRQQVMLLPGGQAVRRQAVLDILRTPTLGDEE